MFLAPMAAYVHMCTCALSSLAGIWCSSTRRGQNLNQEHDSGPWLQTEPRARLSETLGSRLSLRSSPNSQQASPGLSFLTYKTRINIPILAYFTASHWDQETWRTWELLSFRQDSYQKDGWQWWNKWNRQPGYKTRLDHRTRQPSRLYQELKADPGSRLQLMLFPLPGKSFSLC